METILRNIIRSPIILGRFLNTLSLLEYIGARKIIKSQPQDSVDEKILCHADEELRHALVLKRAALRLYPDCKSYADSSLLCRSEAINYFQTIDRAAEVDNPLIAYLITTFLIETRAIQFYTLFDKVLLEAGKPLIFRGILTEEHRHLEDIETQLQLFPDFFKIQTLKDLEESAFNFFLDSVSKTLVF